MDLTPGVAGLQAEGAYAVLARARELEADGREVIHLEIGQPDFPTPAPVAEAGVDAIRAGQTRYGPPAGLPALRERIAREISDRTGQPLEPARVVVAPGAKPGLFFPVLALVRPGDEVIFPDPGFPTYRAAVEVAGGVGVPVPLREEQDFSFDLRALEAALSPRTRLVILNSPANPTGGVIPLADLERIARMVRRTDAWVISDEIYARWVYESPAAPSIASLPGMLERTVLVDGFSKTYAMTGWRLGFMVAPQALAERLELLLTHSVGCTATFTQLAGIQALEGEQEFLAVQLAEYRRRRDAMVSGLNTIPGLSCRTPQGAFYAFPNVASFGLTSGEIARRLLDEAGVAVLAGTDFGPGGEGYLRLCYAAPLEDIEQALEKMRYFFAGLT
jgi:aspartate aminotransferase